MAEREGLSAIACGVPSSVCLTIVVAQKQLGVKLCEAVNCVLESA